MTDALWKMDKGPKLRQFNMDLNALTRRISEQEQIKMSTQTSKPSKDETFVMIGIYDFRSVVLLNKGQQRNKTVSIYIIYLD